MALFALLTTSLPLSLALGAVVSGVIWIFRWPFLSVAVLLVSLVLGQTIRGVLPGQGGGLLVSDVAVILVLVAAWYLSYRSKKLENITNLDNRLLIHYWIVLWLPFLLWGLWSLAVHSSFLGYSATLIAFAYWLRLSCYILLLPALAFLLRVKAISVETLKKWWLVTILALVILGFLQLTLIPRLAALGGGWDPHDHRLVSTWMDPNFFGGFLAINIPWLTIIFVQRLQKRRGYILSSVTLLLTLIALLLTQSRSSLLALLVVLLVFSPLCLITLLRRPSTKYQIRLIGVAGLVVAAVFLGFLLLRDRIAGLITRDPTVSLRLAALPQVWQLAASNSLLGVGYNAYQFAAGQDFTIHSRAGSDNSLLTLWVTTGVLGVVLFALPWCFLVIQAARRWWLKEQLMPLSLVVGLVIWLVHSQFVNSLLYAHLLVSIAVLTILTLWEPSL